MASPRQKRQRLVSPSPDASDATPHSFALAPASKRALAIPEIIEAVLNHIHDVADVRSSRRVCREWHIVLLPRILRNISGFVEGGWKSECGQICITLENNPQYAQNVRSVTREWWYCILRERDLNWLSLCGGLTSLTLAGADLVLLLKRMYGSDRNGDQILAIFPKLEHMRVVLRPSTDRTALLAFLEASPSLCSLYLAPEYYDCDWASYNDHLVAVLKCMDRRLHRLHLELETEGIEDEPLPDLESLAALLSGLPRLEELSIDSFQNLSTLWPDFMVSPNLRKLTCRITLDSIRSIFETIVESPALDPIINHFSIECICEDDPSGEDIQEDKDLARDASTAYAARNRKKPSELLAKEWEKALDVDARLEYFAGRTPGSHDWH